MTTIINTVVEKISNNMKIINPCRCVYRTTTRRNPCLVYYGKNSPPEQLGKRNFCMDGIKYFQMLMIEAIKFCIYAMKNL